MRRKRRWASWSAPDPAHEHRAVAPAADVADELADEAVEILDGVGRTQGPIEGAGHAEALEGQRLGEPFPQRRCRAGMRAFEPGGELGQATLGEGRVWEGVGLLQGAADAGPHGLGEMLEDIARFVRLIRRAG